MQRLEGGRGACFCQYCAESAKKDGINVDRAKEGYTQLGAWIAALGMPPLVVMLLIVLLYVVLGCFLEGIGMVLVTVPILLPLVTANGFDPRLRGRMLP